MAHIVVPQLGESVVEARVARWLKKEGDRVETGEPVVELETWRLDERRLEGVVWRGADAPERAVTLILQLMAGESVPPAGGG